MYEEQTKLTGLPDTTNIWELECFRHIVFHLIGFVSYIGICKVSFYNNTSYNVLTISRDICSPSDS